MFTGRPGNRRIELRDFFHGRRTRIPDANIPTFYCNCSHSLSFGELRIHTANSAVYSVYYQPDRVGSCASVRPRQERKKGLRPGLLFPIQFWGRNSAHEKPGQFTSDRHVFSVCDVPRSHCLYSRGCTYVFISHSRFSPRPDNNASISLYMDKRPNEKNTR